MKKKGKGPFPTADAIIMMGRQRILLIRRKNPPFGWALPGGFLEPGESLEDCVIREIKEETSLKIKKLRQFHTYSEPGRDPRFHTVTTVFTVTASGTPKAATDAESVGVFKIDRLPPKHEFAFDHWQIIQDWIKGKSKLSMG